jgi:hypothetical protein
MPTFKGAKLPRTQPMKGSSGGAESASGAATDKGLEILLRSVADRSAAGLIVQI